MYAYFKTLNLWPTLLLTLTALLLNSYIAMVNSITYSSTFNFLIAHLTMPLGTLLNAFSKFTKAKLGFFSYAIINMAFIVFLPQS